MAYTNRLKKLEKEHTTEYNDVIRLIRQGMHYDELTDEQRDLYCRYHGIDREAVERVEEAVTGSLHFQLEIKQPQRRDEKALQKIIDEVSDYMEMP